MMSGWTHSSPMVKKGWGLRNMKYTREQRRDLLAGLVHLQETNSAKTTGGKLIIDVGLPTLKDLIFDTEELEELLVHSCSPTIQKRGFHVSP